MQQLELGVLILKTPSTMPDGKSYTAAFGYVQRPEGGGGVITRLYSDPDGRCRMLSVHDHEVVRFRLEPEVPYNGVFDALKFVPKPREPG